MRELTLRPMVAADLPKLRDLFAASFGQQREEAYDAWRFLETPYGPAPTIVADDGDRFAGSYTVTPTMLDVGGERIRGAQSMDTMTHPDFRGQGLFSRLALVCFERLAAEGYEALYGFPNESSYPGFIRRLNWDHVMNVPYWSRPITPFEGSLVPLPALSRLGTRTLLGSPRPALEVRAEKPDDAAIDSLLAAHTESKDLCRIARNAKWYAWRYSPPARRAYQWLTSYEAGQPAGFAVIGSDRDRPLGGEAQLCELVGTVPVREALIRAAVARAYEARRKALRTLAAEPEWTPMLRAHGFVRRGEIPLIVKPLTARPLRANLHHAEAWRIVGGDIDVF